MSALALREVGEAYPDDREVLPEGCEVDGRSAKRAIETAADYVVVGSGAAGATVGLALAEAGFSVVFVEEGEWVRTREFGVDLLPAMQRMFRGSGTPITSGRAFLSVVQGSCVGGSTTINSAIAWRPPEGVVARWSREFGLGEDVTPALLDPHFEALERELHVQAVSDEALGENNALFEVAANARGLESHRIRRYDRGCQGSAGCSTGCRTARKLSMNVSFIPKALLAGAQIFTSTRVDRVETRGGRAVAVRATMRGAEGPLALLVHARRGVFVAASAVQTPNVLRRSGIRARALGRHFQAHPGVSIMAKLDRTVQMDFGATQGFNSLALLERDGVKLETLSLPPELAVPRLPGFGPALVRRLANYGQMATWAVVIRSDAEGTVGEGLTGDDVNYNPSARDMSRARRGLRTLCEMMFAVGAKEIYPGVHGMPAVIDSPDQLALWDDAPDDPRAYTMIISHMFGAARMGTDPRTSVVGTHFETHETRGLYVVDSSVFPTNLGVNPQHTIMAMARLAAARVIAAPLARS